MMLGRTATHERQIKDSNDVFAAIGLDRSDSVHTIMHSYERLRDEVGEDRITQAHNHHFNAVNIVLWDSVRDLEEKMPREIRPGTDDKAREKKALDDFLPVYNALPTIDLPIKIMSTIAGRFLTYVMDHDERKNPNPTFRKVVAEIGVVIGNEDVVAKEKEIIVQNELVRLSSEAQSRRNKNPALADKIERTGIDILNRLGSDLVSKTEIPSYSQVAIEKVVEQKRKVTIATMAAAIISGLVAPTAAHAIDSKDQIKAISASDQLEPKKPTAAVAPTNQTPVISLEGIAHPSRHSATVAEPGSALKVENMIDVGFDTLNISDLVAKESISNAKNIENNLLNVGFAPAKSAEAKQVAPTTPAPEQLVIAPEAIDLSKSKQTEEQQAEPIKIDTSNGVTLPEINKNSTERERAVYEMEKSASKK